MVSTKEMFLYFYINLKSVLNCLNNLFHIITVLNMNLIYRMCIASIVNLIKLFKHGLQQK